MGQDPLLYLVQLTRVPITSSTKSTNESGSKTDCSAPILSGALNAEEEAMTVYRGAETSCIVNSLVAGTNYIARVCAIRCCQTESPEQQPTLDHEAVALQASLSGPSSAKIVLLHGPFSVGTAFTTLPEKRTPIGELINSMWRRSAVVKRRTTPQQQPQPSFHQQKSSGSSSRRTLSLSYLTHCFRALWQRLQPMVLFRGPPAASSRDRTQYRMACFGLLCFGLITLFCAWFVNQFLLDFSDDPISSTVKWANGATGGSGGGSVEDSSSSARAALYAIRGRQHHQ